MTKILWKVWMIKARTAPENTIKNKEIANRGEI